MPVLPRPALAQAESREGIYLQNQILQLRQELETLRRSGGSALRGAQSRRGGGGAAPVAANCSAQLLDRVGALEEEVRRHARAAGRSRVPQPPARARRWKSCKATWISACSSWRAAAGRRRQQRSDADGSGGGPSAGAAGCRPPPPAPRRRRPPPAAAPAAAPRTPERAIADGQAALSRRDYAAAEAAAREVLATRNAPRAADAQLLLADALAGKRDYAGAALAYNDAYVRGRTGPRAPEALLGLANAFANLGHKREACDTLDDLRGHYPNLRRRRRSARRTRAAAPAAADADDGAAGAFEHFALTAQVRKPSFPSGTVRPCAVGLNPPSPAEFAALMAPLGPFGPAPRLAAGVSGGPHSLALALLAADWARRRGGDLLALVVDHGLRPESGGEAEGVVAALARRGIAGRMLRLGLPPGAGLQERARAGAARGHARSLRRDRATLAPARPPPRRPGGDRAVPGAARERAGRPRGHGAGAGGSRRPWCCAPCSAWRRRGWRPWSPASGIPPVRDPTNADARFARTGLRATLADPAGTGPAVSALAEAASAFRRRRAGAEAALAARLAAAARLHAEGFAEIDREALGEDADRGCGAGRAAPGGGRRGTSASGRGGAAAAARGATARCQAPGCGGGRGGGWRLLREPGAAVGPAVPARPGILWDRRFRMTGPGAPDCTVSALRAPPPDVSGGRRAACPRRVLATFPAIRRNGALVAVPAPALS